MKDTAKTARRRGNRVAGKEEMIPFPSSTQHIENRQLEKLVSWTAGERLLCLWHGLRLAHSDIEYAFARMSELQRRLP